MIRRFQGHQVELAVAHTAFSNQRIRETAHLCGGATQDQRLYAVLMIQVTVHACHHKIVVFVLQAGQALSQDALAVVVDVREIGDTQPLGYGHCAIPLQRGANQIAHSLGAVAVATRGDQGVEFLRKPGFQ